MFPGSKKPRPGSGLVGRGGLAADFADDEDDEADVEGGDGENEEGFVVGFQGVRVDGGVAGFGGFGVEVDGLGGVVDVFVGDKEGGVVGRVFGVGVGGQGGEVEGFEGDDVGVGEGGGVEGEVEGGGGAAFVAEFNDSGGGDGSVVDEDGGAGGLVDEVAGDDVGFVRLGAVGDGVGQGRFSRDEDVFLFGAFFGEGGGEGGVVEGEGLVGVFEIFVGHDFVVVGVVDFFEGDEFDGFVEAVQVEVEVEGDVAAAGRGGGEGLFGGDGFAVEFERFPGGLIHEGADDAVGLVSFEAVGGGVGQGEVVVVEDFIFAGVGVGQGRAEGVGRGVVPEAGVQGDAVGGDVDFDGIAGDGDAGALGDAGEDDFAVVRAGAVVFGDGVGAVGEGVGGGGTAGGGGVPGGIFAEEDAVRGHVDDAVRVGGQGCGFARVIRGDGEGDAGERGVGFFVVFFESEVAAFDLVVEIEVVDAFAGVDGDGLVIGVAEEIAVVACGFVDAIAEGDIFIGDERAEGDGAVGVGGFRVEEGACVIGFTVVEDRGAGGVVELVGDAGEGGAVQGLAFLGFGVAFLDLDVGGGAGLDPDEVLFVGAAFDPVDFVGEGFFVGVTVGVFVVSLGGVVGVRDLVVGRGGRGCEVALSPVVTWVRGDADGAVEDGEVRVASAAITEVARAGGRGGGGVRGEGPEEHLCVITSAIFPDLRGAGASRAGLGRIGANSKVGFVAGVFNIITVGADRAVGD